MYMPRYIYSSVTVQPAFPNLSFSGVTGVYNNGQDNKLYVLEVKGKIYVFNSSLPSVNSKKLFLDLSSIVPQVGGGEGLLCLAFHPNYATNRQFFVSYNYISNSVVYQRISRFTTSPTNPDSALRSSEVIYIDSIRFDRPGHYGSIIFGFDGYFYFATGDNSWDNDTTANRGHLAQDMSVLYGKMLRIDVDHAANGKHYSIPVTNPYYGNTQGIPQEIYAVGFRNPWRMCRDSVTGKILVADVGESNWEELNILELGANYGWNMMEGFYCNYTYPPPNTCDTTGRGYVRPIWNYSHNGGGDAPTFSGYIKKGTKFPFWTYSDNRTNNAAIIGGYVYRGTKIPSLYGKYVCADFLGKMWAVDYDGINHPVSSTLLSSSYFGIISSFGEDINKELYVSVFDNNKPLYKMVAPTLNLTCLIEGFYNPQTNIMVKDTVRVFLRSTVSPYLIIDSSKSVLDSNGNGSFSFPYAVNGVSYYIVVKHRNSIETWSKSPGQDFTSNSLNYNFTSSASQAYGNNMKQVGTKWTIYSGDASQDGFIDASDLLLVDNDVMNFESGYRITDINGDLTIDLFDLMFVDNNAINFVSKATP